MLTSPCIRVKYPVSFLAGEPGQPVETSVSLTGEKENHIISFPKEDDSG